MYMVSASTHTDCFRECNIQNKRGPTVLYEVLVGTTNPKQIGWCMCSLFASCFMFISKKHYEVQTTVVVLPTTNYYAVKDRVG